MLKNKKALDFLPTVARLDGADPDGLAAALNGGELRLEGGSVAAYAGPRRYRIGYLRSEEVRAHLVAGGSAGFRPADGLDPTIMICGLFHA